MTTEEIIKRLRSGHSLVEYKHEWGKSFNNLAANKIEELELKAAFWEYQCDEWKNLINKYIEIMKSKQ